MFFLFFSFFFLFFFFSVSPYLIGYIISNSTLPLSFPSCWSDFVARNSEYTCTLILVHYHFYPTGHTCSTVKGERSTNTCCHWTWWWWTTDQWIHSGRFTCIRDKWSCANVTCYYFWWNAMCGTWHTQHSIRSWEFCKSIYQMILAPSSKSLSGSWNLKNTFHDQNLL